MSRLEAVVCYTVGEPGAGKTYRRCAVFLGDQFLPNTTGHVFTNYPIHIDEMAEHASQKSNGRFTPDEIKDRIHIIPEDVLRQWRLQQSGPWDYFAQINVKGAIIAIDEIHNFCPAEGCKTQQKWQAWLGEIRHSQAQAEFLTQDPAKCNKIIERHTGIRRRIEKDEHRCDPFFKIPMKSWYEFVGAFTGSYEPKNWEIEQRRLMSKWVTRRSLRFRFDPEYYKLYDSFSAPIAGGGKKADGQVEYEFQRRSKIGMCWWIFWQAPHRFFLALLVVIFFALAFSGQGGKMVDWLLLKPIMSMAHSSSSKQPPSKPVAAVASPSPMVFDRAATEHEPPTSQPAIPPELLEQLEQLKHRNRQLESQMADASAIVLLEKDSATFRDGYTVKIGEVVEYGDYKGSRLVRIDWRQRTAVLHDGRLLRMGRGLRWSADDSSAEPRGSDVPAGVPDAPRQPEPPARRSGQR